MHLGSYRGQQHTGLQCEELMKFEGFGHHAPLSIPSLLALCIISRLFGQTATSLSNDIAAADTVFYIVVPGIPMKTSTPASSKHQA